MDLRLARVSPRVKKKVGAPDGTRTRMRTFRESWPAVGPQEQLDLMSIYILPERAELRHPRRQVGDRDASQLHVRAHRHAGSRRDRRRRRHRPGPRGLFLLPATHERRRWNHWRSRGRARACPRGSIQRLSRIREKIVSSRSLLENLGRSLVARIAIWMPFSSHAPKRPPNLFGTCPRLETQDRVWIHYFSGF